MTSPHSVWLLGFLSFLCIFKFVYCPGVILYNCNTCNNSDWGLKLLLFELCLIHIMEKKVQFVDITFGSNFLIRCIIT